MKKSLGLDEIVGKSVAYVRPDGSDLTIAFSDGTYVHLSIDYGWEGCDSEIESSDLDLKDVYRWLDLERFVELGVVTREEVDAQRAANIAKAERAAQSLDFYERQQYEQLKRKFEGD